MSATKPPPAPKKQARVRAKAQRVVVEQAQAAWREAERANYEPVAFTPLTPNDERIAHVIRSAKATGILVPVYAPREPDWKNWR